MTLRFASFALLAALATTGCSKGPKADANAKPATTAAKPEGAGATAAGAFGAMRRVLRLAPAEAMRPPAPARYRPGLLSWLRLTRVAGPLGQVIVREVERKPMALRLQMGEAGLVKTVFGWHIIKRVPPPPPDALESAAILARAPVTEKGKVKHILLGWTEVNAGDERGKKRTRAELDALVAKTVAALTKGAKIEPLMKELSEDPGSAANGNSYDVDPNAGLVAPFKNLSLRLNVGEVGVVKTQFGFHIIQRTE